MTTSMSLGAFRRALAVIVGAAQITDLARRADHVRDACSALSAADRRATIVLATAVMRTVAGGPSTDLVARAGDDGLAAAFGVPDAAVADLVGRALNPGEAIPAVNVRAEEAPVLVGLVAALDPEDVATRLRRDLVPTPSPIDVVDATERALLTRPLGRGRTIRIDPPVELESSLCLRHVDSADGPAVEISAQTPWMTIVAATTTDVTTAVEVGLDVLSHTR